MEGGDELVMVVGADGRLRAASPAVARALGYDVDDLIGADASRYIHPDDLARMRAGDRSGPVVFRMRHARGGWRHLEVVRVTNAMNDVAVLTRDITETVALGDHLQTETTHDALTGLPNRSMLHERLEAALAQPDGRPALFFVDLDRFKDVNETLGHTAGDTILVAVASRLRRAMRPGDTVVRFGGDEFVVMIDHITDPNECAQLAARITTTLAAPFTVQARDVRLTATVGTVMTTSEEETPESLLRNAHAAAGRAKIERRERSVLFEHQMRHARVDTFEAATELLCAIDRDELTLLYQPQVDLVSNRVVGVEAFAAWRHPTRGLVRAHDFLDLADDTGLIAPIGAWAVREACLQGGRWLRERGEVVRIAVNVAARHLAVPEFPYVVRAALAEGGLTPDALCLEITEGFLTDSNRDAHTTLTALHEIGVKIAIDDFGTGNSALAHLKQFPVDELKIDGRFVAGLGHDSDDTVVVAAVIGLAHALGVVAIAEGVEHGHQLDELRALKCDRAQGFLFAKPSPAEAIEQLLVATR